MKNQATILLVLSLYPAIARAWQGETRDGQTSTLSTRLDASPPAAQESSESVTLREHTPVCLLPRQRMSTDKASVNDRVGFRVAEDLTVDGVNVVSKGTEVWGTIAEVRHAKNFARDGKLSFNFEPLNLINGQPATLQPFQPPKQSAGQSIATTLADPYVMFVPLAVPFLPLLPFKKGEEVRFAKSQCVAAEIAQDVLVKKSELLDLQPASGADLASQVTPAVSEPEAILAGDSHLRNMRGQPRITEIDVGFGPQGIAFTPDTVWVAWGDKQNSGVSRIDAGTNRVVATVRTGKWPVGVAAGEGAVWVVNRDDDSVDRIDPETNTVVATIPVGRHPLCIAVGEHAVWVTNEDSGSVSRMDPQLNAVVATIKVGRAPSGIAVSDGIVWVTNYAEGSISRIDPTTNKVKKTIMSRESCWPPVLGRSCALLSPNDVVADKKDIWVTAQDGKVLRIDGDRNKIVARINVPPKKPVVKTLVPGILRVPNLKNVMGRMNSTPGKPTGAALYAGFLWVPDWATGLVWKIDIQTNVVVGEPIAVGSNPLILGPGSDGNGSIWVANSSDGSVMRIQP